MMGTESCAANMVSSAASLRSNEPDTCKGDDCDCEYDCDSDYAIVTASQCGT